MKIGPILAASAAAAALLSTTGCADPCAKLEVSDRDRTVLQNGGEVEREVGGAECELSDESVGWERDS